MQDFIEMSATATKWSTRVSVQCCFFRISCCNQNCLTKLLKKEKQPSLHAQNISFSCPQIWDVDIAGDKRSRSYWIVICANCCWQNEIRAICLSSFFRDLKTWKSLEIVVVAEPPHPPSVALVIYSLLRAPPRGHVCWRKSVKLIWSGCVVYLWMLCIRYCFGIECCLHQKWSVTFFLFSLIQGLYAIYQSWFNTCGMCWHFAVSGLFFLK